MNKLRYIVDNVADLGGAHRVFRGAYNKFSEKVKFEKAGPRNKRFLALVDRRQRVEEEDGDGYEVEDERLIMFEPPEDAGRDIPKNVVSEHSMCASSICVIPSKEYQASPLMTEMPQAQGQGQGNEADQANMAEKLLKQTITCKTNNGAFLTLSFHVKTEESIKVYLYINGQYIRFMPEDIVNSYVSIFC